MVPKNGEAGAAATADTGQECLEGIPANTPSRPNPASAIDALAELFPVFVADWRKPHRPLKLGVHQDLLNRGVLTPKECHVVLPVYTGRRQYQKALAAGGPRFDLDGNPAGEVTAEQVHIAKAKLAAIKQKMKRRDQSKPKAPSSQPDQPAARRLGIGDLKAAAAARRQGTQSAGGAVNTARVVGGE